MLRNFLLIALAVTSIAGSAQNLKAIQRKIIHLEAKGHYVEAAKLHIALHDEGEREASIKAAMSLYKISRYKDAISYFQHADSIGTLNSQDEIFGYFQCLKALKKYQEADDLIRTHLSKKGSDVEFILNKEKEKYYTKVLAYKNTVIKNLPFNTVFSEFGPTVLDGWLYFESTRITAETDDIHGLNNQAYFNLYAHPIGDTSKKVVLPKGNFGKPQVNITSGTYSTPSIPEDINSTHHDGPVYVTPEGKHLFYTTNWDHEGKASYKNPYLNLGYSYNALENSQKKEAGKIHLNIYYSINENNTWSIPKSFSYNNDNWSNQHAFFDEKTSTLYYSSNMPGGMGGFDIWRSVLNNDIWSTPENLGPNVNTARNEGFPSISPDGYFIFASNGWPGLGGLDLFLVETPDAPPVNLMAGLNTEMDDFGVTFVRKGEGYVVSNRSESIGDDDIFYFTADLEDIIAYNKPSIQITLIDQATSLPTVGTINFTQKGIPKSIPIGRDGYLLRFWDPTVTIEAKVDGYEPTELKIDSPESDEATIPVKLQLKEIPRPIVKVEDAGFRIRLEEGKNFTIFLDYQRFNKRKNPEMEMLKLAQAVLKDNPNASISFQTYNKPSKIIDSEEELFNKRLQTTASILMSRGIQTGKINSDKKFTSSKGHDCNDQSDGHSLSGTCMNQINIAYPSPKKNFESLRPMPTDSNNK